MGMVFQAYSLFPNMTAAQNVEYGLKIRKQRGRIGGGRRSTELLELVGLGHAGDRYPHQLSGGMQQRVALARALAIEPRVLLLDEPLSALDAKVRVQLREEIRRIQLELGITTLYVTHDQEEALSISDRVAVLSQGQIEQMGTPAEMYSAPATPFVAEFIGTMNRLEATVADPQAGEVDYGGVRLAVDAVRGRSVGERVLVLVRPETVELGPASNGAALTGEVISHTFLGPVTRLKVTFGQGEMTADVSASRAGRSPSARASRWASRPEAPASSASDEPEQQLGTVGEDPVDTELEELAHAPLVVDRVDGRPESEPPCKREPAPPGARVPEAGPPREARRAADRDPDADVLQRPQPSHLTQHCGSKQTMTASAGSSRTVRATTS